MSLARVEGKMRIGLDDLACGISEREGFVWWTCRCCLRTNPPLWTSASPCSHNPGCSGTDLADLQESGY
jgi:hypothetical protein